MFIFVVVDVYTHIWLKSNSVIGIEISKSLKIMMRFY